ncbi:hypothetical protein P43SY_002540 [Pythium insidiosum]|uniref:Uncharacterized protein n=1 Tax=Pythium insidiosum TaxID=114742 RepID=A0AAD5MC41_PYTIN|nr:hypothetical protein P43SY_002540 [Pythium insidiosum]
MDVPTWHPANQDGDSARLAQARAEANAKRTEFKVMPGSSPDVSTEAGRVLMSELGHNSSAALEGRGFFDSSDRLYLLEQKRLDEERATQQQAETQAELEKFRSTALKVQAQRNQSTLLAATESLPPRATSNRVETEPVKIVSVKPKRRSASEAAVSVKPKPKRRRAVPSLPLADASAAPSEKKPAVVSAAKARLIAYSSSSDSDSASDDDRQTEE